MLTSWYVVWSLVRLVAVVLLMASAIALDGFSVGFFIVVIVGLMDDIIVDRVLFDVSCLTNNKNKFKSLLIKIAF